MDWVTIHLPRAVAELVGQTAARQGVTLHDAIAAALWMFAQLPPEQRRQLIWAYKMDGIGECEDA